MLVELTSVFSGLKITKTTLNFGVLRLFISSLRPDIDVKLKTNLSHFELKNAAFDLDIAFYMCQIEFESTGNTVMGIIKFIFSSRRQVCIGD